ncbi:MAG: PAS domain-containing protein [Candidatus Margulisbacteria bacterium]|nr:PAS domain-containing protein [Candidatus Margulisiibacteriota bacterium]
MVEIPDKEYQALQDAREIAESTINAVREPLVILDGDLKVMSASRAFYQTFQVKPAETEQQFIYDLGNKQWDIPALRKLLEGILPSNESFDNYEVKHDFPGIGKRIMLLNARRIPRPPAKPRVILLAIEDITEKEQIAGIKRTAEELKIQVHELEEFHNLAVGRELKMIKQEKNIETKDQELDELSEEISKRKKEKRMIQEELEFILGVTKTGLDIIDKDFNLRFVDKEWQKVYGPYQGKKCYEYFMDRTSPCDGCGIPEALSTHKPVVKEERLAKEGNRPIRVTTIPFKDEKGEWLVAEINVDISNEKKNG